MCLRTFVFSFQREKRAYSDKRTSPTFTPKGTAATSAMMIGHGIIWAGIVSNQFVIAPAQVVIKLGH